MKEEVLEILAECAAGPNDEVYRVTRSFYAITKAGPWTPLEVGSLIRLSPASVEMNYPFRVLPEWLPLEGVFKYECVRSFRFANDAGYWENANVGDILELDFKEAEPLLRNFSIKPIQPNKGGTAYEA